MARNLIKSDKTILAIRPGSPLRRLNDGDGLYLLLFVNGGAHGWRYAYSLAGRRNNISLGTYPDVTLAAARAKAAQLRSAVAQGLDPSDARKAAKLDLAREREQRRRADAGLPLHGTFEAVAREWFDTRRADWSASYGDKVLARLEADVFPYIGTRPVGDITAPELLAVLRRIEARGVIETAHRAHESCSQVFRFAVGAGLALRA